jgi:hypothetical protein
MREIFRASGLVLPVLLCALTGCGPAPPVHGLGSSFILPGRFGAVAQCAFLIIHGKHTEWNVKLIDHSPEHAFQLLVSSNGHWLAEAMFLDAGNANTLVEIRGHRAAIQDDIEDCPQR